MFTAGVSALDVCLSNCTWSGDKTIDLYPWDAGTDDGVTYMVRCLSVWWAWAHLPPVS